MDSTSEDVLQDEVMIEPAPDFSKRHSLVMASSLADLKGTQICKVRVMNPFDRPAVILENTVLGFAEPFTGVLDELVRVEDEQELDNQDAVRRIQLCRSSEIGMSEGVRHLSMEQKVNAQDTRSIENPHKVPSHLQDLFQKASDGKTPEQKDMLESLLCEYQDVFSKDETDLGLTNIAEHEIDTSGARPIKQAPRRVPTALLQEEKQAIDQMLKQGVIQESTSPWASPIVLVRKKNGKIRTCIDYRKLNDVTVKDAYPIPSTQECLDALSGAEFFSTLDMTSGYNQIPVRKEDVPKTAFATRHGLFEFKAMPFGLTNAPATFQRVMEIAMRGLQWTSCLIYLDDIIIFGSTFEEHQERLMAVLQRVRQANLKLKPEKCALFQKQVPFLGHVVSQAGIHPNPDNIAKVKSWDVPKNVTEVKQFLGLCSYYRRFVKGFSTIAKPLSDLTSKDSDLVWSEKCQEAFESLKQALVSDQLMGFPQDEGLFILDTDACDVGIGAVLSQMQDGRERVIAYASRSLNKAERNYCVTDKELLAIKHFVEYFKQYLVGREFLIRTDHQALKWLFSLKEPKGRIARWIEILSAYHFTLEYRPGKNHGNADGMSRHPSHEASLDILACGPCKKCQKRSEDMQSAMCGHEVRRTSSPTSDLAEGEHPSRMAYLRSLLFTLTVGLFSVVTLVMHLVGTMVETVFKGIGIDICPLTDSELQEALSVTQDDGRLWPKLSSFIDVFRRSRDGFPSKHNDVVRKVETRSSSRSSYLDSWFQVYSQNELQKRQCEDACLGSVVKWLKEGNRPIRKEVCAADPELRHYWNLWGSLVLHNGLVYKQYHRRDGVISHLQLLLPRSLRQEALQLAHDNVWSGHLGRKKTTAKVSQRFYWYDFRTDVDVWVTSCDVCASNKPSTKKPKAPLGDMRVGAPLDRLCLDVLGPLPLTKSGNRYILVVCDAFTKWAEAFPIPDQTAKTCASVLVREVISRFGCPLELHTDQGRNFDGEIFKELSEVLHIRKTRTSPHHPQCNGQCERFNRTLLSMIRSYIGGQQETWDQHLSSLTAAYRSTLHESTGFSPNLMMLGREVRLPREIHVSTTRDENPPGSFCSELRESLFKAHQVARKHLKQANQKRTRLYDDKVHSHVYQPGDLVWVLRENRKEGVAPKLQPCFEGPFLVLKKLNELDYLIQLDQKGSTRVMHHDKFKPYLGKKILKWANKALRQCR